MAFKKPTTVAEWEKFMKAYAGWSPAKTANSINNYGYSQVKDFLKDAEQTFGRQLTHGVGRTLGQFANSFNPQAIDKQSKSAMQTALEKEKTNVYGGLNNLKKMASDWKDILDENAINAINGLVASAAKWYGEDVVKSVGFVPGGKSEITIDTIGGATGQSQPQTFKINQKTGAIEGGDVKPVEKQLVPGMSNKELIDKIKNGEIKTFSNMPTNIEEIEGAFKSKEITEADRTLLVDTFKKGGVDTLVRKAFEADRIDDLAQQDWWRKEPLETRQEAYRKLQEIQSSPESLAQYVSEQGITNLQNYSWWNANPNKQQAWQLISQGQVGQPQTGQRTLDNLGATTGTPAGTPPGTTYVDGKMVFSTNNPQLDDFLNNTYVPLLTAELSGGDPNEVFNTEAFAKIKERIDKTWGPIFEQELKDVQSKFDLNKQEIEAQQLKTGGELQAEKERTLEDTGIAKQRIARNYTEALTESQLAMAARKLTFGGTRKKEEAKLATQQAEQLGDVERTSKRSLEDLQRQQDYSTGAYGRQLTELGTGLDTEKRRLEGEKTLTYAQERERLRTLGGSLLQNPEFLPQ